VFYVIRCKRENSTLQRLDWKLRKKTIEATIVGVHGAGEYLSVVDMLS